MAHDDARWSAGLVAAALRAPPGATTAEILELAARLSGEPWDVLLHSLDRANATLDQLQQEAARMATLQDDLAAATQVLTDESVRLNTTHDQLAALIGQLEAQAAAGQVVDQATIDQFKQALDTHGQAVASVASLVPPSG